MTQAISFFVFVFGAVFGSFLNVCIHRFPRGESIVHPGSHCPGCQAPVAWYDNIPLISYLMLRAKCRKCDKPIAFRYFLVELVSGMIWLGFWSGAGFTGYSAAGIFFFMVLLAVSATDLETGYIPDKLTFPGMAVGLTVSALIPELHDKTIWYRGMISSVLGLLAGGGILVAIGLLGNFLFKKESMGGGDVKLLAMMGSFVGLKKVILIVMLAPIAAVPFAIYVKWIHKKEIIPFGPFLALTGACLFLYGDEVFRFLFHV